MEPPVSRVTVWPASLVSLLLTLIVSVPVAPAGAAERDGVIIDGAGVFSASALADATEVIRSIEAFHQRDVCIETYAEVPSHLREDLARDGRDKFYDDWLNRRARQLGVRGVFVLITRSPGRVQVGVHKSTQRRAFPPGDRDALRDQLAAAFRVGRYDQGLLDGLRFVRRKMDENTAAERNPTVPAAAAWH